MDDLIQDSEQQQQQQQQVAEEQKFEEGGAGGDEDYDEVDFKICGELGKQPFRWFLKRR